MTDNQNLPENMPQEKQPAEPENPPSQWNPPSAFQWAPPAAVPYTPYVPPRPSVRPVTPLEKRDGLFFLLMIPAVFLFMDFAFFSGFSLGFTLSFDLLFLLATLYLAGKGRPTPFSLACGLLSLAAAAVPALYRDPLLGGLMILLAAGCFSLHLCGMCGGLRERDGAVMLLDWLSGTLAAPFHYLTEPFRSAGAVMKNSSRKRLGQAFLGLVLAVPVLCVVVPLLIRSDAAYESMMASAMDNLGGVLLRLVLTALFAPLFISWLFAYRKELRKEPPLPEGERARPLSVPVCAAFLALLSAFYLSYLFSQLAYFFSAFAGMLPQGYTLTSAEYARRGFFELAAIAGINIGLLLLVEWLAERTDTGRLPLPVRGLSLFICLFTLLLTATAFSKMALYIRLFGMTRLRVLTSLFMGMLAAALLFLILRLFLPRFPLVRATAVACGVLLTAAAFIDVDRLISRYNVEAYRAGALSTVDTAHLGQLSVSAVPSLIELLDDEDPQVARGAGQALWDQLRHMETKGYLSAGHYAVQDRRDGGFARYNAAEDRACRLLIAEYGRYKNARQDQSAAEEFWGSRGSSR